MSSVSHLNWRFHGASINGDKTRRRRRPTTGEYRDNLPLEGWRAEFCNTQKLKWKLLMHSGPPCLRWRVRRVTKGGGGRGSRPYSRPDMEPSLRGSLRQAFEQMKPRFMETFRTKFEERKTRITVKIISQKYPNFHQSLSFQKSENVT